MKSHCVKQKKVTECVPGSEKYVAAKNGRTMMKCQCAECGIAKTKFVKGQKGGEAPAWTGQWKKPINLIQKASLGSVKEPGAKESFDDFWSGDTGQNIKRQFTKSKAPYKQITKKKIPGCESDIYNPNGKKKWFNFGCPGSLTQEESYFR